ncbi:regulator of G-protein signaling protein-like isoform X3 [Branchiostoma floridae]|uniref:Regulator of G-protein signaling protein-like isoform X3 n=1 Tax=Branchiostoma floridae TaxID=7739 RepID=A0A9J7HLT4_BRAFL|nr:regulator of G-protein signaling protein-like isoform X3 [Branchiostoma floridae]
MEWDLEGYAIGSRPSLPEFGELLEDVTFVDYFNIFLSLPVFGQSLFYRRSVKKFELHPSINKAIYVLDRQKLQSWVIRERFSLFLTSDLYVEYLLNKRLRQTMVHLTPSDRDGSNKRLRSPGDMLRRALKKARGMRRFRQSLAGTPGRCYLAFWLDAEMYRRQPCAGKRRVLLRNIIRKYFCNGAALEMPPAMKLQLLQAGVDEKLTLQAEFSEGCPSPHLLVYVQQEVLNTIQSYWLPRYMGWCRARYKESISNPGQYFILDDDYEDDDDDGLSQTASITNITVAGLVQLALSPAADSARESVSSTYLGRQESDIAVAKEDGKTELSLQEAVSPTKSISKKEVTAETPPRAPPIVRIVEPDGTVTQARSEPQEADSQARSEPKEAGSQAKLEAVKKESQQAQTDEEKAQQERNKQVKQALHQLKTKYPMRLTPKALSMLQKQEKQKQKKAESLDEPRGRDRRRDTSTPAQLTAWRNKFKRKMRKEKPEVLPAVKPQKPSVDKKSPRKPKPSKNDTPRMPIRVELSSKTGFTAKTKEIKNKTESASHGDSYPFHLPHLRGDLPQPTSYSLYSLYKEQQEVFLRNNKFIFLALESDRLAGDPFCSYLDKESLEREKNVFKFWQAAQELLNLEMTFSSGDKTVWYDKSRRLVETHMRPGLVEYSAVGLGLGEVLRNTPPSALWCVYLQQAQINITATITQSWKEYCEKDIDNFQKAVSIRQRRAGVGTSDYLPLLRTSSLGMSGLPARKSSTEIFAKRQATPPLPGEGVKVIVDKEPPGLKLRKEKAVSLADQVSRTVDIQEMEDLSDYFEESDDELSLKKEKMVPTRRLSVLPKKVDYKQLAAQSAREYPNKWYRPVQRAEVQGPGNSKMPFFFRSVKKHGVVLPPPSKPKNFLEVLRHSVHLEYFKRYLMSEGSEAPLLFWIAVENMRVHSKDNREKQAKSTQIVRRYFSKQAGKGVALQCEAQVIKDIAKMGNITPAMLLSAQAAVGKSLGDRWYEKYRDCFPDDSTTDLPEIEQEEADSPTDKSKPKVISLKAKTRAICIAIVRSIIGLRHALHRRLQSQEFEDYLRAESFRPNSANIATPNQPKIKDFETTEFLDFEDKEKEKKPRLTRRFISGRVIYVEKLPKDVAFFKEVECYKALADEVAKNASAGEYSMDEDELLKRKASAIIKCFLESSFPPKVQINIPPEMASHIIADWNRGFCDRGLFYDATMTIFPTLVHFWKKFCREKNNLSAQEDWRLSLKKKTFEFPDYLNINTKSPYTKIPGISFSDPPRLLFSMAQGPRLITPPKLPENSDDVPEELMVYLSARGEVVRGVSPNALVR